MNKFKRKILKQILLITLFLMTFSNIAISQTPLYSKKSRIGLYLTTGIRLADLSNDEQNVYPQKIVDFNKNVLNWGGGIFLGNITSDIITAVEVNLYKDKSVHTNKPDVYFSGSDYSLLSNMLFFNNRQMDVFVISGFTVSFLTKLNPNAYKGYYSMQNFEDSYYSTSVNYLVNIGLSYEYKFDLFDDEKHSNDLSMAIRLISHIPLTSSNRFNDKGKNKINYPFLGISIILSRIKNQYFI